MKTDNQVNSGEESGNRPSSGPSGNRRKLIRGGALGLPIVLALKSTPVLATNCKLPSGFSTSGNLSRTGGAACVEPAHSPDYWKTNIAGSPQKFSGTKILTTKTFKDVFGGTDDRTFLAVLNTGNNFASLVVAAYLGIKSNSFVGGVTTTHIVNMWKGSYRPTLTAPIWSNTDSENYLRYVMGLPPIN